MLYQLNLKKLKQNILSWKIKINEKDFLFDSQELKENFDFV